METQSRFDQAAATWDETPSRVEMAQNIAQAIKNSLPSKSPATAIDFGCGTGLVTIALQPFFQQITGIDSSRGMLEKLQEKITTLGISNINTKLIDLTSEEVPADLHAEVIFSAMALHHIADLPALLKKIASIINPGGLLALADLDAEDGSFHQNNSEVHHHGIQREYLKSQLTACGFHQLTETTAHVMKKADANGEIKQYPVFLITGIK